MKVACTRGQRLPRARAEITALVCGLIGYHITMDGPGMRRPVLATFVTLIGQVLSAAGSVVGYRHATEEPSHSAEKLTRDVEIRRYAARIAAETTVSADEQSARSMGFRRLAGYIFGANQGRKKIPMTAPFRFPGNCTSATSARTWKK